MGSKLENELEPISMATNDFIGEVSKRLTDNPQKAQPVYFTDPETQETADFFFLLVNEGEKIYIQAEGFNSQFIEKVFSVNITPDWKLLQPGIYRLEVDL